MRLVWLIPDTCLVDTWCPFTCKRRIWCCLSLLLRSQIGVYVISYIILLECLLVCRDMIRHNLQDDLAITGDVFVNSAQSRQESWQGEQVEDSLGGAEVLVKTAEKFLHLFVVIIIPGNRTCVKVHFPNVDRLDWSGGLKCLSTAWKMLWWKYATDYSAFPRLLNNLRKWLLPFRGRFQCDVRICLKCT